MRVPVGLLWLVRMILAAAAPSFRQRIQEYSPSMALVTYTRTPILSWRAKEREWVVEAPFTALWKNHVIKVPMGSRTDLASIPRLFRSLIPQVGRHLQPAIVHDILYRRPDSRKGLDRAQADRMFLDGMESVGVGWARRWAMYTAVRAAGASSFAGEENRWRAE